MSTAVEFRHLRKVYGDTVVIPDFSLCIEKGEFVTIIGSSGCGKTTVLKMINGLYEPSGGDVFVNGKNIRDLDLIALRRSIGYSIQGSVLFPHMTVEQNIAYVPNLWNRRDREKTRRAVDKWMDIVGLDAGLKERYPAELSGGQQQRVGIARALAASPEILLMDEPFGAVDAITRGQLQKELKQIYEKTGITVFFVTHDIDEALRLGTRILVMDRGEIQQYGTPDEVLRSPKTDYVKMLVARYRDEPPT
ncbi:ATP-binding cassette domain-containing protein [Hornefia butyriciproducens]|uniref:ABC-type quaternary amine transporter n=1 Tax=Hornefia butyriciproducens TaxID=2652293 RepID=A0A6L5Y5M1_9FIRM|nr:ABC transporter ATP-binding protein [Hornefia butyriciproducens]MST51841.1 ABC transporter ATP-binding protein [Hornefia butyriciproducens]